MESLLKDLTSSQLILIIMVGAFFFKEWFKDQKQRKTDQAKALAENTVAIIKLETQLKSLNDSLAILPGMQRDITAAHQKLRELGK